LFCLPKSTLDFDPPFSFSFIHNRQRDPKLSFISYNQSFIMMADNSSILSGDEENALSNAFNSAVSLAHGDESVHDHGHHYHHGTVSGRPFLALSLSIPPFAFAL
jgi:hypothetical protein